LEETYARKSTESALKLQSPSPIFAAETLEILLYTQDVVDAQDNAELEDVEDADADKPIYVE
jgi:hypothetical protein